MDQRIRSVLLKDALSVIAPIQTEAGGRDWSSARPYSGRPHVVCTSGSTQDRSNHHVGGSSRRICVFVVASKIPSQAPHRHLTICQHPRLRRRHAVSPGVVVALAPASRPYPMRTKTTKASTPASAAIITARTKSPRIWAFLRILRRAGASGASYSYPTAVIATHSPFGRSGAWSVLTRPVDLTVLKSRVQEKDDEHEDRYNGYVGHSASMFGRWLRCARFTIHIELENARNPDFRSRTLQIGAPRRDRRRARRGGGAGPEQPSSRDCPGQS